MRSESSNQSHLGEFDALKDFFDVYYHEDAEQKPDAEIWAAYRSRSSGAEFERTLVQLRALLSRPDEEVHRFFRAAVGNLYFLEPSDTRAWLLRLLAYFQSHDHTV
jgi:hypothetical protein